jgi:TonB family protein
MIKGMRHSKYLLLIVFALTFCYMYAQTESKTVKDSIYTLCIQCDSLYNRICPDSAIFGHPESLPQFFGGDKALMMFLKDNVQYPSECKEQAIQGRIVVKFIIDESGKIICPYIHRSLHLVLDKEALRVIKLMPDWKPASNNGVSCKACYILPILFKL